MKSVGTRTKISKRATKLTSYVAAIESDTEWISLKKQTYVDAKGVSRTYECAFRSHASQKKRSARRPDGVAAIATTPEDRLILVSQFRPPLNSRTLEFPAGLLDDDEDDVDAAIRELAEETGFVAKRAKSRSKRPNAMDPGFSDCTLSFVTAECADEVRPPLLEATEAGLTTHSFSFDSSLSERIASFASRNNLIVDSRLEAFLLGVDFARDGR